MAGVCLCALWLPSVSALAGQERRLEKVKNRDDSALVLTLRVQARDDSAPFRDVDTGVGLRTGDRVRFQVMVDKPAYVYIVQYFADDRAKVLYPEEGDALLQPGHELSVPEAGYSYELRPPAGHESVYFIATETRLAQADARAAELIRLIRGLGASPSSGTSRVDRPARGAPPPLDLRTRGELVRVPDSAGSGTSVRAAKDGVAIYVFTIRQTPAP